MCIFNLNQYYVLNYYFYSEQLTYLLEFRCFPLSKARNHRGIQRQCP